MTPRGRTHALAADIRFDELLETCATQVHGYLRRQAPSEADDLTQLVVLRAYEAIEGGQGPAPGAQRQWLFTIAKNALLDFHEKDRRTVLTDAEELKRWREAEGAVEPPGLGWVTRPGLSRQLELLPDRERRVTELRFGLGLSYEEVAPAVGCASPGAARFAQARAMTMLRGRLAAGGRDPRAALGMTRLPSPRRRGSAGGITLLQQPPARATSFRRWW